MPPDPSHSNPTSTTIDNHDQSSALTGSSPPESPPVNVDPVPESNSQSVLAASPVLTPDQVAAAPHANQPPSAAEPFEVPAAVPGGPVATPPSSNKRSWFGVLHRSANKEPSIIEVKAEAQRTPDLPNSAVYISPESSPQISNVVETKASDSAGAVANPTPGMDVEPTPQDTASESPCPPSTSQSRLNKSDASSACQEQQISQPLQTPLPQHSPGPQIPDGTVPPNSTTSVSWFNFSTLARSRPPAETMDTPSPPEPSADPPLEAPTAKPDLVNAFVDVAEPTRVASPSTMRVLEAGNQSLTQPTTITGVRTHTWWSYLRLNGNSTVEAENSAHSESIVNHPYSAAPDQSPASDPAHTSLSGCETKVQVESSPDACAIEHPQSSDKSQSSVYAPDSANVPQSSTWYTPWSWYQPTSSATVTASSDMNSGSHQDPSRHPEIGPETGAKLPTEDQVPCSAPTQVSPLPQDPPDTGSVDYSNPIQSVITANPTGWMSFFTAKAIAMKSITYEKEDGKMEVMEIDDEISPEPNTASPAPPAVIHQSPTQVTKPSIRAQPPASDVLVPPASPPKKSDDKRPPIPHAATYSETVINDTLKRQPSPSPSKQSGVKTPASPPPPNLVLPTWSDTFHTLPRSAVPHEPPSALSKTLEYVSGVLFSRSEASSNKSKGKAKETVYSPYDKALPRTWDVSGGRETTDVLRGCKRVVIIGIHGWFPGTVLRTLAGEPTGTSSKFVSGIADALESFQEEHKVKLEKVTKIPLEGEGTINRRVERLYQNLIGNKEWMDDLHDADAIFVATHSQGSVVSTHILDRLIADRHIRTPLNADASIPASGVASGSIASVRPPQRICCLVLCGIHLGPLRYLGTSSLVQPYIQYFESTAARELFEFQNTESAISRDYVKALRNVLNNGIKMVYIASLNDQVVGLYSGLFTSISHPLILRALYIDGDAYHPSDFLSNLLVLLLRIRNAGLSDGGLLTHLSEVTAGSLNGIGHSTPYEERATYSLAIDYLFLADGGSGTQVELVEEPFNALAERNDYEIPWALRDLIADDRVSGLFSDEIVALRDAFRDWHPKTTILREVKRKLQPIQRLSSAIIPSHVSKL